MKKIKKKLAALLLSLLMVISLLHATGTTVESAAKPKLVKKSASIVVGKTSKIQVKNVPKGAKITYKPNKKNIVKISKKGIVKGIKVGTTNIIVSITKNAKTTKLTYKVTVKKSKHRYKIYDLSMSWDAAKAYCKSLGGHLATITSQQEQNYIESILVGKKEFYWLGGKRKDKQNEQWAWITGEKFSYTNWADRQPDNNYNGKKEFYLGIVAKNTDYARIFTWNDFTNEGSGPTLSNAGFICEWDAKN